MSGLASSNLWPRAELDAIDRLRVMSRALPGVVLGERLLPASFEEVWEYVTDFERSVPEFESDVEAIRVVERAGDRVRLVSYGRLLGRRFGLPFEVELRPGWCWMHSSIYVVGMAAVAEGNATRFAHLEGVPLRGPRHLRTALAPVAWASRIRHHWHVPADLKRIEAGLAAR